MREITEREWATLVRCGKVLAARRYRTEDVKTANAIRQVVLIGRKLTRNTVARHAEDKKQ